MSLRRARATAPDPAADPIRTYLRQIGQVPLLNKQQERDLGIKIQAGMDAEAKLLEAEESGVSLPVADRRRLERIRAIGQQAKDRLTEANLRLVVNYAKKYTGSGMPLLDLIQAGNIGLMRAVEKFDHTMDLKFSTYATWWIKQGITRTIADQSRTIRVPVHMFEQVNKVKRTQKNLAQELEREPEIEEIAEALGMEVERVSDILRIAQDPTSLETPVGDEGDSTLGDFIGDESAPSPADEAEAQAMRDELRALLNTLTERERQVIERRFGLIDDVPRTLEEVGREFGVTRERIRQIESKTLLKLRTSRQAARMRAYVS